MRHIYRNTVLTDPPAGDDSPRSQRSATFGAPFSPLMDAEIDRILAGLTLLPELPAATEFLDSEPDVLA